MGTASVRSDALCLEAVSAYTRLYRRSRTLEPDAGVAQSYVSGCRSLEARAQAQPWMVPIATIEEATLLLRVVEGVADQQVDEWIDLFSLAFLETIDRRHVSNMQIGPLRRRFRDRTWVLRSGHPRA
jgi:hypothetical protein